MKDIKYTVNSSYEYKPNNFTNQLVSIEELKTVKLPKGNYKIYVKSEITINTFEPLKENDKGYIDDDEFLTKHKSYKFKHTEKDSAYDTVYLKRAYHHGDTIFLKE